MIKFRFLLCSFFIHLVVFLSFLFILKINANLTPKYIELNLGLAGISKGGAKGKGKSKGKGSKIKVKKTKPR